MPITFIAPEADPRIERIGECVLVGVFPEHADAFHAHACCRLWLRGHGLEMCTTQAMRPTAVIPQGQWSYGSSKWTNIAMECLPDLAGYVVGRNRHGPLRVMLQCSVAAKLGISPIEEESCP